jgi:hypothetical protein
LQASSRETGLYVFLRLPAGGFALAQEAEKDETVQADVANLCETWRSCKEACKTAILFSPSLQVRLPFAVPAVALPQR